LIKFQRVNAKNEPDSGRVIEYGIELMLGQDTSIEKFFGMPNYEMGFTRILSKMGT
jgi:hypothetical protein